MTKSIYIDATHFGMPEPTGVERYVDELLPRLSALLLTKSYKVSWVGHHRPDRIPEGIQWVGSRHQNFWSQRGLPKLLKQKKPDFYFTPSGIPPVSPTVLCGMTVHDLSVYDYPDAYTLSDRFRLTFIAPKAARRADCIFTPTQYVREDIVRKWNIPSEKIIVTPLAYSEKNKSQKSIKNLEKLSSFALFVGRIETKKNLLPLIHAIAATEEISLVLVGKGGHGNDMILAVIREFPESVQRRIYMLGYITEAELAWLYTQASSVVVPGLAEGFGLSVLEGYFYQKPVIASASGALPEVAGDAAVLIDGRSSTAWQEALLELFREPMLRESLVRRGTQRLANFSWDKCAMLTAEAIIAHCPHD